MKDVTLQDEMRNFKSPISGKIIMEEFNLKPGKEVGEIKKLIENAIIDGIIKNKYDAAFQYMKDIKKKQN